ncbi:hypothetical protein EV121DRAFT_281930 [Schizophyllum commune]
MPATPPACLTTPTTKLATYADLYRLSIRTPISTLPIAAQARKCCQAKDLIYALTPMCSIQQERKSAAVSLPPHHASSSPQYGTLCRGHNDATRRYHDLDMQVRCGDGLRPIPSNSRDPQTAGGLRANTRVLERCLIPKPCLERHNATDEPPEACARPYGDRGEVNTWGMLQKMSIRSAARLNANDGVMVPKLYSDFTRPPNCRRHARGHPVSVAKAHFHQRARRQGGRSRGRATDRACKISPDERSSPVRQCVEDRGRTAVSVKSGDARNEHKDDLARHTGKYRACCRAEKRPQRERTKNSRSRTLCVPAVALNLHASPPPRMPSPRSTAGETMPDDEVRCTQALTPPPSPRRRRMEGLAHSIPQDIDTDDLQARFPCASSRPSRSAKMCSVSKWARGDEPECAPTYAPTYAPTSRTTSCVLKQGYKIPEADEETLRIQQVRIPPALALTTRRRDADYRASRARTLPALQEQKSAQTAKGGGAKGSSASERFGEVIKNELERGGEGGKIGGKKGGEGGGGEGGGA